MFFPNALPATAKTISAVPTEVLEIALERGGKECNTDISLGVPIQWFFQMSVHELVTNLSRLPEFLDSISNIYGKNWLVPVLEENRLCCFIYVSFNIKKQRYEYSGQPVGLYDAYSFYEIGRLYSNNHPIAITADIAFSFVYIPEPSVPKLAMLASSPYMKEINNPIVRKSSMLQYLLDNGLIPKEKGFVITNNFVNDPKTKKKQQALCTEWAKKDSETRKNPALAKKALEESPLQNLPYIDEAKEWLKTFPFPKH
jgi:hypothetical protein